MRAVGSCAVSDPGRTDGGKSETGYCRAPSCWERGTYVVVDGATEIAARLCEKHRKAFLGVSS